jgi:hypothetical protein
MHETCHSYVQGCSSMARQCNQIGLSLKIIVNHEGKESIINHNNLHTLFKFKFINPLPPNVIYICRTTLLTSRRYILNISSTNIRTEYFKRAA